VFLAKLNCKFFTRKHVDTSITYGDIYNAYEENEIVADDKYDGNRNRITAKITSIHNNGFIGLSSDATLWMETK
jgi:hypothetical protein